jgi:hypothetical protein
VQWRGFAVPIALRGPRFAFCGAERCWNQYDRPSARLGHLSMPAHVRVIKHDLSFFVDPTRSDRVIPHPSKVENM